MDHLAYRLFTVGPGNGTEGRHIHFPITDSLDQHEIDKVRKISEGKLIAVERKELENALANSKERLKYSLDVKVIDILKSELGDFEVVF